MSSDYSISSAGLTVPDRSPCGGFTLLELMVVIAIVVLLCAIMSPSFVHVRRYVHVTVCRSNLHQLSLAHDMYTSDNDGTFFEYRNRGIYMDFLEPYHNMDAVRFCPKAPLDPTWPSNWGSHRAAWTYWTSEKQQGSYGINGWIYSPLGRNDLGAGAGGRRYGCARNRPFPGAWYAGTYAVTYPSETPTFADCSWVDGWPWDDDLVFDEYTGRYGYDREGHQMSRFVIDRHNMTINVALIGGQVTTMPLGDLWLLRWSAVHQPVAMQIP